MKTACSRDVRDVDVEAAIWSCSLKKFALANFVKFRGKHLCQSLFFNKDASLRPETSLKIRLWHRCFLVNLRVFQEHLFYRTSPGAVASSALNPFMHNVQK